MFAEQSAINYKFPIAFASCLFCGGLGYGLNMYGGNYIGGAVKSFWNTGFTYIGGNNGGSTMMALALGY